MPQVVVSVRYPLTSQSRATLRTAIEVATERDTSLTVLHVNLYQNKKHVNRRELKDAIEREFGTLSRTRYVVRDGLLVEETILDEVAAQNADVVVIGTNSVSRWRSMIGRIVDDPDVERFLRNQLDVEIVTASPQ